MALQQTKMLQCNQDTFQSIKSYEIRYYISVKYNCFTRNLSFLALGPFSFKPLVLCFKTSSVYLTNNQ